MTCQRKILNRKMWAAENPIKMKHKSKVNGRTHIKIKRKETQSVPRCHIKCSKLEVRIGGLLLIYLQQ